MCLSATIRAETRRASYELDFKFVVPSSVANRKNQNLGTLLLSRCNKK